MKYLIKLKILYLMLSSAYSVWYAEVAKKDLSENYCCDGRECCCEGATIEQIYTGTSKHETKEDIT